MCKLISVMCAVYAIRIDSNTPFFTLSTLHSALVHFDISPPLSPKIAVFPGDVSFAREVAMDLAHGDNLTLSSIRSTLHVGAHVDAPSHYHKDGASIENRKLDYYLGDCQVIEVALPRAERIQKKHLQSITIQAKRVLFKTLSFPDPNVWHSDFNSLSPELVHFLADQGAILVGIDTPSIDPADDAILESHHAVYERNLAILEGIVLEKVPEGVYQLIALPLPIVHGDASPVRAILLPKGGA